MKNRLLAVPSGPSPPATRLRRPAPPEEIPTRGPWEKNPLTASLQEHGLQGQPVKNRLTESLPEHGPQGLREKSPLTASHQEHGLQGQPVKKRLLAVPSRPSLRVIRLRRPAPPEEFPPRGPWEKSPLTASHQERGLQGQPGKNRLLAVPSGPSPPVMRLRRPAPPEEIPPRGLWEKSPPLAIL